ncbi:Glucose-1-phosphate cytidylyltransferase [compost metagenome]
MVLNPEIFNYIDGDSCVFEKKPLEKVAEIEELKSYIHSGFWQCMDTKREKDKLEELWESGKAPWKKW